MKHSPAPHSYVSIGLRAICALTLIGCLAQPVAAANTSPVAANDTADHFGRSLVFDPLANDVDADGQELTLSLVGETCTGTIAVEDGLLRIEPAHIGRAESCTATYRVTDTRGASDTATVTFQAIEFPIFLDGFESNDAAAWGACVPTCP
ncbi:MAG: Ig-like domain-containing protein [Acidobacteriota bacterium]